MKIELKEVTYAVGNRQTVVDLSLTIEDGERCVIAGPNGSGKSTILRLLAGLYTPKDGMICLGGDLCSAPGKIEVDPASRGLAMMFQDRALWSGLTVRRHLEIGAGLRFSEKESVGNTVAKLLDEFDLTELERRRVEDLSGGEQQRVALARCLAGDPDGLLLDEPFASLDSLQVSCARDFLVKALSRRAATLLAVVHRWDEIAAVRPDRIIGIKRGKLVADCCSVDELRSLGDPFFDAWAG